MNLYIVTVTLTHLGAEFDQIYREEAPEKKVAIAFGLARARHDHPDARVKSVEAQLSISGWAVAG